MKKKKKFFCKLTSSFSFSSVLYAGREVAKVEVVPVSQLDQDPIPTPFLAPTASSALSLSGVLTSRLKLVLILPSFQSQPG